MTFIKAVPERIETYKDANGNAIKYFLAGWVYDTVYPEHYVEYWIEGAEVAALPADNPNVAWGPRQTALQLLVARKIAASHAIYVAKCQAEAARTSAHVRTPQEVAAYPLITPEVLQAAGATGSI